MNRFIKLFLIITLLLGIDATAFAVVRYVTAGGCGEYNGSSWGDAYYCVQTAIINMVANNETGEIRVMGYTDSTEYSDCGLGSIECHTGISIKGGYLGYTDGQGNDPRDPSTHKTVLTCATDTVIHAAGCASDTVIDGLIIKGGTGRLVNGYTYGGGIYCDNGGPTISNCIITNNSARYGAGICCVSGACPIITGCTIENNTSAYYGSSSLTSEGAGILMYDATISDCIIRNNKFHSMCGGLGGGVRIGNYGSGSVTNCTIEGNGLPATHTAFSYNGGGVFATNANSGISNTHITNNGAFQGGGAYLASVPNFYRNTLTGNNAVNNGGGVFCSGTTTKLRNCLIASNTANNGGGVYFSTLYSTSGCDNSTIVDNCASTYGGGLCISGLQYGAILSNNIIANHTRGAGSGIFCPSTLYSYTVKNSCLFGNTTNFTGTATAAVEVDNVANATSDTVFENLGNYRLKTDSVCIDKGLDSVVSPSARDIDGQPRQVDISDKGNQDVKVDVGADEYYPDYANLAIVNRELPQSNLNQSAHENRFNFRWADASSFASGYGDDFKLYPGPSWCIDKVTVWAVPDVSAMENYSLGDYYRDVTLYLSDGQSTTVTAAKSVTFTGNTTGDPGNVTVSSVHYGDGSDYQCADGTYNKIWKIEFTNLNWPVFANGTVRFGVLGTPLADRLWFNHASYSVSSGSPWKFDTSGVTSEVIKTAWFSKTSSDINVQVYAHPQ